jgi:DNA-binding XRE family transcriptional regulator
VIHPQGPLAERTIDCQPTPWDTRKGPCGQHRRVLGEAIRTWRKRAGLTQESLAEKSNLSAVYISRVECGKENISVDATMRIAKAVGARLRDLFQNA